MKKGTKYVIWVALIIVLAVLVYLIISGNNKTNQNEEKNLNAPALEQNNPSDSQVNAGTPVTPVTPVYTKEIGIEFMTDAEKAEMKISPSLKIQVLERGEDGTVLAYKIIRQDSDIMDKYGN